MSAELFQAIERHELKQLAALLAGGADANTVQTHGAGWRPLHAAIEELEYGGSVEALLLLLRHGAAVNAWDGKQEATALLMALFRDQLEAVRILLAAGADPNVRGGEGDTPLRWCVEHADLESAGMLIRCGAALTINDSGGPTGMSALGCAASQLNVAMIKLLLDAGADPEALDSDRRTAREVLPPRETDPQAWDATTELLGHKV